MVKFASPSCVCFISFGFLLATICVWVWMVFSLHSVTTGSRDRANVSLIIIIIIIRQHNAVDCKSCCCRNGKIAKKSNESEVEYSTPPGIGFSFACCHPSLFHQADVFQMLVDSGSSKHFVDPKFTRGVESRMLDYTEINPSMEVKAAGHNTLFGIA